MNSSPRKSPFSLPPLSLVVAMGGGLLGMPATAGAIAIAAGPPWSIQSSVEASVTDNNDGTWTYDYTVYNDSAFDAYGSDDTPVIVDWEIPYFDDAGITDVLSPAGWSYNIETIGVANAATGWSGVAAWQDPADPFYQGPDSPFTTVTEVIHWHVDAGSCDPNFPDSLLCEWDTAVGIWPSGSIDTLYTPSAAGFSLTANYGPTDGPYQASWDLVPVLSGDPPLPGGLLPASPNTLGTPSGNAPLPASLLLLGVGLLGLGATRRKV